MFTLYWYQTDICCHNANIEQPCSIYSPDNYTCSDECYDLPQEVPKKEDRSDETKNIEFYFPRQGKCSNNQYCCQRTRPRMTDSKGLTVPQEGSCKVGLLLCF